MVSGFIAMVVTVTIINVWPSGAAAATCSAASAVAAPGLFSMMKAWPRRCCSPAPTMRARMSVYPPAGYGTTIFTGPFG